MYSTIQDLFQYTSDKVLENTFKVMEGIFSGSSMFAYKEPKGIMSDNNMLLQYGSMSNSQCHL